MKKCPKGKVLNPKTNRCINKKTVSKKTCPKGKVLNPKTNRCINKKIPSKKIVKSSSKKTCPKGKILNPKTNRCVIDRSLNKIPSKKLVKSKQTPKELNKKQTKTIVNSIKNTPNDFTIIKKKRVLYSSWYGATLDTYFGVVYLINKYKDSYAFLEHNSKKRKDIFDDSFSISYINRTNNPFKFKVELPLNMSKKMFIDKVKNCNKRFVILPILIEWYNDKGLHLNMIVIDNLKKIIERFEPNQFYVEKYQGKKIYDILDKELKKLIPNYKYFQLSDFAPFDMMVQDVEKLHLRAKMKTPKQIHDAEGYCAAWSIWYAEMRLKFPDLSREKLIEKSLRLLIDNKHSLRTFIRSYSNELTKYRRNLLKKTHFKSKCKEMDYTSRIIDLPLKEYQCMIDYISKKYPSND